MVASKANESANPSKRAVLYCRQSDSGGDGVDSLSIESQEIRLRQHAESQGWSVLAVERDADLRGWQDEDERPGLAAALRRAEEDGYVLLVWDLSRLAGSCASRRTSSRVWTMRVSRSPVSTSRGHRRRCSGKSSGRLRR